MDKRIPLRLVAIDLDQTSYPTVNWLIPGMKAATEHIARRMSMSTSEVVQSLSEVFVREGTDDFPFVLETSALVRRYGKGIGRFITDVVAPYWELLDQYRETLLRPYPDVVATVQRLREMGLPVVALTNSNCFDAMVNVTMTGIAPFLSALYAPGPSFPANHMVYSDASAYTVARLNRMWRTADGALAKRTIVMPPLWVKPGTEGLARILKDFRVGPDDAVLIGDNPHTDGGAAQGLGVNFIWDTYGVLTAAERAEMRDLFSIYDGAAVCCGRTAYPTANPLFTVQTFGEVLSHIG